ncbi:MAG: hypothetical protein J7M25_07125 [Deltaproteobacteria bacterium]|nr:hypothetical protein [Deltaproteobacteria bacterium]
MMTRKHTIFLMAFSVLTAGLWPQSGCAKKGAGSDKSCDVSYKGDCDATKASGVLLKSFGKYDYDIPTGTSQDLKAMVIHIADGDCNSGGAASGADVHFKILTPNADASLSLDTVQTGDDGVASVQFTGNTKGTYQVQASADGTCPVNFTLNVIDALRGLKPTGPTNLSAWTRSRLTLVAKAYMVVGGQGEYPLSGEDVTFELGAGGSGTSLQNMAGTQSGNTLTVKSGANGLVMAQFNAGTEPVPNGVQITATLQGSEPVTFTVTIKQYSDEPCQTNADCPVDFPVCDDGTCTQNPTSDGSCTTNADCVEPYECVDFGDGNKRCVKPNTNGQRCDPIEMTTCPDGQVCIGGFCTDDPRDTSCVDNDDCPGDFICQQGTCVADPNQPFHCVENEDCTGNKVCVAGECVDQSQCTPKPDPTRLQGTWSFDSTLHLREAVAGWLGGFLSGMEFFRDIILGNLDLGLPGWLEDLIEDSIKSLINEYIPPWGQDLIVALGDLSDILDDMRILHTVQLVAAGNYEYVGTSTWDLIQFEYRGQTISGQPQNIPEIGHVPTYTFTSREICRVFVIDRHEIKNVVGGLIKWVIDALVSAVTCSVQGWGCYDDLQEALQDLVDCDAIADAIDGFVSDAFGYDGAYDLAHQACESGKGPAIQAIVNYLDQLTSTFSVLTMRGQVDILDNNHMGKSPDNPGRWYGTLAGGNWQGTFTAVRQ